MSFLRFPSRGLGPGVASASPLLGVGLLTGEMVQAPPDRWSTRVCWALFWTFAYSAAALGLLWGTLATFDRCVGRVTPRDPTAKRRRTPEIGAGREEVKPSGTAAPRASKAAASPDGF
jgi:hypothetical protein